MSMLAFDAAYTRTDEEPESNIPHGAVRDAEVRQLILEYGGASYQEGLYRIFNLAEALRWTATVSRFFPAESAAVEAFARDWQGNLFTWRGGAAPCVHLFQPGAGDVFEVSESLDRFHNEELVEHAEEALSFSLWQEWRSTSPAPSRQQCVAYRQPVFLGGGIAVDNLVLAGMDVYWEVTGQLLVQVRNLPDGAPVERIDLTY
ncbi:MAG: SMI1/KNR4 family protein [Bryobacterales bacterium]|nr:SMI1/KNR4 family protein [Bryobacterales bacterium]